MASRTRDRIAMATILVAAVALGASREFLFLNLNYQLDAVAHQRSISYAHSLFQGWVQGWDLRDLVLLKWSLALLFSVLMALACIAMARVLFGDHRHRRTVIFGYLALGTIALALNSLGSIHPAFGAIGVKVLHTLQYPVLLFFVWAAATLGPQVGKGG
jgi:hypothetical protein